MSTEGMTTIESKVPIFLGQLFPPREQRNFEKAHLKAFIKGHQYFRCGFKTVKDVLGIEKREPMWHEVQRGYKTVLNKVK